MKQYLSISILISFCFNVYCTEDVLRSNWTWLYHTIFTEQELAHHGNRPEIVTTKVDTPHFSQLLFSWNAYRPACGFFTFFVQVRDAQTKQWGKWHRMVDWGARVQCSYVSKFDAMSEYLHVRLEVPRSKADGFRIKMVGNRADMSFIRSYAVCLSNFSLFSPESQLSLYKNLPSTCIQGVPRIAQLSLDHHKKESLCSPTSCSMLLSYLLNKTVSPIHFATMSFDHGLKAHGSWPFNMAHAFEYSDGRFHFVTARAPSFKTVYQRLKKGLPVVVSVRGPLEGAPLPYSSGHLLVIVGWDTMNQEVICHDPACHHHEAVEKRYPLESFLRAWERSHRLVYLARPVVSKQMSAMQ